MTIVQDGSTVVTRLATVPGGPGARAARLAGGGAAAPAVPAGPLGNTDLQNYAGKESLGHRKALNAPSHVDVLYAGVDTAHWSFLVPEKHLEAVLDFLAQLVGQGELEDESGRFIVSRIGFPYAFKVAYADGFVLTFPHPKAPNMPVSIQAGARLCLALGDDLENAAVRVLASFFSYDEDHIRQGLKLSRVDPCLDVLMLDRSFQHMSRLVGGNSKLVVTRAKKYRPYCEQGRYTGFVAGEQHIILRNYDKHAEALVDGDWPMWSEVYKLDAVPEGKVISRIEWQLRREFLRQCCMHPGGHPDGKECPGIRTLAEFRKAAPALLEYLCTSWFRFCGPARGGKHERPTLPIWQAITRGFENLRWSELTPEFRRRVRSAVPGDTDRLADMAVGCLSSIAAHQALQAGEDAPKSLRAMLAFIAHRVEHDDDRKAKWEAACRRRFDAMPYGGKAWRGVPIYRDVWTGKAVPV